MDTFPPITVTVTEAKTEQKQTARKKTAREEKTPQESSETPPEKTPAKPDPKPGKQPRRKKPTKAERVVSRYASKSEGKKPPGKRSESQRVAERVAEYLYMAICKHDPGHKYNHSLPPIDQWGKELEQAILRDGRTGDQLIFVIDYIFAPKWESEVANFWQPNVQTGGDLCEKFETIKGQIIREAKTKKSKSSNNGRATISHAQDLTKRFEEAWGAEAN